MPVPDYTAALRNISMPFSGVYIVLDALDENTEEERFIVGLQEILGAGQNIRPCKTLIASRHSVRTE
jgi:hypothetical protein